MGLKLQSMYCNVQSIAYVYERVWYSCIFYSCLFSVWPMTAEQKPQHSVGSSEDKYFWLGVIILSRAKICVKSESWGLVSAGWQGDTVAEMEILLLTGELPHHLPEGLREDCRGKEMALTDQQRRTLVRIVSLCTHTSAQAWELGGNNFTQSGVVLRVAPWRRFGHIGMRKPGGGTVPSMASTE